MGVGFLPPITAAWTRRYSLRQPAGQVAFCWLVMAFANVVGMVRYFVLGLPPQSRVTFLVTGLFPLLLLPPTLTWVGGTVKRWQRPVLLVWGLVWAVAVAELFEERTFRVLFDAPMALAMCAVSLWALAAQVRRARHRLLGADWYWILIGHVVYFAVDTVRSPLLEALVAHHWDIVLQVHNGFMLLYAAAYFVIARGVSLSPPAVAAEAPTLVRRPA